jgi:hypothetical protein
VNNHTATCKIKETLSDGVPVVKLVQEAVENGFVSLIYLAYRSRFGDWRKHVHVKIRMQHSEFKGSDTLVLAHVVVWACQISAIYLFFICLDMLMY